MGDNTTNFKINSDGSVTMENVADKRIDVILEILEIERAKGGFRAPRRMRNRALEYARAQRVDNSDIVVEKLMLQHYPELCNCMPLYRTYTKWLMISLLIVVVSLLAGIIFISEYNSCCYSIDFGIRSEYMSKEEQISWIQDQVGYIDWLLFWICVSELLLLVGIAFGVKAWLVRRKINRLNSSEPNGNKRYGGE